MSGANGQRRIDLDAMRTARLEKLGPAPVVRFAGKEHPLPPEQPADYALSWVEGRYKRAVAVLLGDDVATEFFTWASIEDVWALGREIDSAYGLGQGEASASVDS